MSSEEGPVWGHRIRDLAIASIPTFYLLGVLTWAIYEAREGLPFLPLGFTQLLATGLTLSIFIATAVVADHYFVSTIDRVMSRQTATWPNQLTRLLLGAASKGLAILVVYILLVTSNNAVPILDTSRVALGNVFGILAVAVVGLQLVVAAIMLLPYVMAPLTSWINRFGMAQRDLTDVVGGVLQEFPVHRGPMGESTPIARFWGGAVLGIAFLAAFSAVLIPAIHPSFGGVPSQTAILDVDAASMSPAASNSFWHGAVVSGVTATPPLQVIFANESVVVVRVGPEVLEIPRNDVHAIHWQ